jgi:cell division septation protein DedD
LPINGGTARASIGIAGLALLSACASSGGGGAQVTDAYTTDYYIQHAAGSYQPPGPPSDPWGPYIRIAAARFDVPQAWIREVMRVESGGHEYLGGQLTVSSAGAMGLMQLEPETYGEMAARYGLGDDPFNPYNNIMAGTAYIHEMYAVYGSPGFLAAYNAGPGRLDKFVNGEEPLPNATQQYVAMIAPNISGYYPHDRSEADQLALNTEPMGVSTGILPPGFQNAPYRGPDHSDAPVEVAAAVEPSTSAEDAAYVPPTPALVTAPPASADQSALIADNEPSVQPSAALAPPPQTYQAQAQTYQAAYIPPPPPPTTHHFQLINSAMADTPSPRDDLYTGAGWAIQLGAYSSRDHAKAALGIAELSAVANLMHGEPMVERIDTGYTIRYRARFVNLPHRDAIDACQHLIHGPTGCTILSPDAQG